VNRWKPVKPVKQASIFKNCLVPFFFLLPFFFPNLQKMKQGQRPQNVKEKKDQKKGETPTL
jgi:hypothetical protein